MPPNPLAQGLRWQRGWMAMRPNTAAAAGGRAVSARQPLGTPRCRGAELRQATRDKVMQDLLHRTEYLASIVSQTSAIEVPAGEALPEELRASKVPHLVDATNVLLRKARQAAQGTHATPLFLTGPSARARSAYAAPIKKAAEAEEHSVNRFVGVGLTARGAARGHVQRIHSNAAWEDACQSVNRMLDTFPQPPLVEAFATALGRKLLGPHEVLKVRPVPGPATSQMPFRDHLHAGEMEWRQHANGNCRVEWLGEEGVLEHTAPGLRFARHFWGRGLEPTAAEAGGPSCFLRVDGGGESATHKFTLMESGRAIVRQEGLDPFHSHALVTADKPLQVFPEGHYFEVRLVSTFRTAGPPERPRQHGCRTEGLVLGVTTSPPAEADTSAQRVGNVAAAAWCVSLNGSLYSGGVLTKPRRPPVEVHLASANRGCPSGLLPASDAACAVEDDPEGTRVSRLGLPPQRQRLKWTAALREGDALGMLVTPFGGIIMVVNGEKQLLIPDADVPNDVALYPLVEAYNHVRSVRLVLGATPPK